MLVLSEDGCSVIASLSWGGGRWGGYGGVVGGAARKGQWRRIPFGSAEFTHLGVGLVWREEWPEVYSGSLLICGLAFGVFSYEKFQKQTSHRFYTAR